MEDLLHLSRHQEPAWVEGNTLGEVGQVADLFKVSYLFPGQLYCGLAWDPGAWLKKADGITFL